MKTRCARFAVWVTSSSAHVVRDDLTVRLWGRRLCRSLLALLALACGGFIAAETGGPGAGRDAHAQSEAAPGPGRTILIGFDGMDPELTEQWMADGTLPNFARLAREGHYQKLQTTNPAQSPVAWASFATGLDPGQHGIFDFLHRNPDNYAPEYSISFVEPPDEVISAFGYRLPLEDAVTRSRRVGTPFWFSAEREGHPASVLRVPVTYPADPISRMLSGMGVPDLLGSQGTFTFYTTEAGQEEGEGGRTVLIEGGDDRVETVLEGPPHPFYEDLVPLSVPLVIEDAGDKRVRLVLDGQASEVAEGAWSGWVPVEFSFAALFGVKGLVRFHVVEAFPTPEVYVSPIQLDPRAPAGPISAPSDYAAKLAERIGLYHTIGMPEETWSLNEERISDRAWLEMEKTILEEREAMLFDVLEQKDSDLVVAVFVQTDRVSHMFWRGLDPEHPLHDRTDELARTAIPWIYGEADRILGRVMETLKPEDRLIVLSDHGFDSFRRVVHLNRWLADEGYLVLEPGQSSSGALFSEVDWLKTRAFALGLNGIFINLQGRESFGIVSPDEAGRLKREIERKLEGLRDPEGGERVVLDVHDRDQLYRGERREDAPDLVIGYGKGYRASWQTSLGGVPEALIEDNTRKWSGDHCIEPSLVPGVLFTSFKPTKEIVSIGEVPGLIRETLGLTGTVSSARAGPTAGALEVASPAFAWADRSLLGWLPPAGRIAVWAAIAAVLSFSLYRLIWRILGGRSSTGGRRFWTALGTGLIAAVPLILILVWVSNGFDQRMPEPGERIDVRAVASGGRELPPLTWRGEGEREVQRDGAGSWSLPWPSGGHPLQLIDSDGTILMQLPTREAVSSVHQQRWWDALLGSPAGRLPGPGDVAAVEFGLPQTEILPLGPAWMRGWAPLFFLVAILTFLLLFTFAGRTR
jgi:predicted AlkP superfamily phosphohydrolase/phosphomutase